MRLLVDLEASIVPKEQEPAMDQELPAAYQKYLDDAPPEQIGTLRPVMLESVAEGTHGILVRGLPSEIQAMVSEAVPYGEVREQDQDETR